MNRQHAGNGFRTWRLGEVSHADGCVAVEVKDGHRTVALVMGKDEREARANASVVAISPEMYRALAGAAACLERFMAAPEELAATPENHRAK